jgi:hypothetical protein
VNSASGHWPMSVFCFCIRLVSFRLTDWCCHAGSYCYPTPKTDLYLLSEKAFLSLDLATLTGCSGRLNRTGAVTDVRWNVGLALTRSCSWWLGPSSLFASVVGGFASIDMLANSWIGTHVPFLSFSPTRLLLISPSVWATLSFFLITLSILVSHFICYLCTCMFLLYLSSKRFAINWALLGFRDPARKKK